MSATLNSDLLAASGELAKGGGLTRRRLTTNGGGMGRAGGGLVVAVVLMQAMGCGNAVEGHPVAGTQSPSATTRSDDPFEEHAVDNECVLSAVEISALAGMSLGEGQNTQTKRSDGSVGRSCTFYLTAGGILSFTASIKVMRPRQGRVTESTVTSLTTPGTRTIEGIGRAVLVGAKADFPQAWVLTDSFVVSVLLVGSNLSSPPTDQRWADAAREIIAKLPTS